MIDIGVLYERTIFKELLGNVGSSASVKPAGQVPSSGPPQPQVARVCQPHTPFLPSTHTSCPLGFSCLEISHSHINSLYLYTQ